MVSSHAHNPSIDYMVQLWREGEQYLAHAMPLDVMTSGDSPQDARRALAEAVHLFLVTARDHGTLSEVLQDCGYTESNGEWQSPDWVGIESQSLAIPE